MILIPTHNKLRDTWTFKHFVRQFSRGVDIEKFGQIPVVVTEDNCCYVWDGTHRITAAKFLGIELPESLFSIYRYTYKDLESINFEKGYVTPFNPAIECRKSFHDYKNFVLDMYKRNGPTETTRFILSNRDLYCEKRTSFTFSDMIPK